MELQDEHVTLWGFQQSPPDLNEVPDTSPRRYSVEDTDVALELFKLNSALNTVGE